MRARQKSGHNIAEHHRLSYGLEDHCDDSTQKKNECEVGNKSFNIHISIKYLAD